VVPPLRFWIYAVQGSLPRLEVAREVVSAEDAEEAVRAASSPRAPGVVAVEGHPALSGAGGEIVSAQLGPHRQRLEVEAHAETVVVIRDAWAAGWSATVNGHEAPLLRADGRHRAVPVARGRSVVELRYRPPGLRMGLMLAGLALLTIAALARLHAPGPRNAAPNPRGG
jgi:hypothetical protein